MNGFLNYYQTELILFVFEWNNLNTNIGLTGITNKIKTALIVRTLPTLLDVEKTSILTEQLLDKRFLVHSQILLV